LTQFAPDALAAIKARYPDMKQMFNPGGSLGVAPQVVVCELALAMLAKSGDAGPMIRELLRKRLAVSRWIDLAAKLATTGGSGGALATFLGHLSFGKGGDRCAYGPHRQRRQPAGFPAVRPVLLSGRRRTPWETPTAPAAAGRAFPWVHTEGGGISRRHRAS
jgi:hypothetical protein